MCSFSFWREKGDDNNSEGLLNFNGNGFFLMRKCGEGRVNFSYVFGFKARKGQVITYLFFVAVLVALVFYMEWKGRRVKGVRVLFSSLSYLQIGMRVGWRGFKEVRVP
jgi:hypothetical protein